ncbi:SEFIR domain-containing protein, partial [Sandaracinobacter sp.]|uniref:SEFIR domain-containing protein n=1 Tax=Sandaracinobacter sp. TaxID=2487581 RepID=UPI0035B2785F
MTHDTPKLFVSYSWTSESHKNWVRQLAEDLCANGVDTRIDIWHCAEGQDLHAFMESMVLDDSIQKVLIVCDSEYVAKANARRGGVGIEARIISPEVYKRSDQTKFAGCILAKDAQGDAELPVYLKGRLAFDFTDDDNYAVVLHRVVRWVYNKPFDVQPPIGPTPPFLNEN